MSTPSNAGINVAEIQEKINQMSEEDMRKILFDATVKQKVATKKYYNPDAARKTRQTKSEALRIMRGKLEAMPASDPGKYKNKFEEINAAAAEEADKQLAEAEVSEVA